MSDYAADREFSDAFIPAIKNIVGPRLLMPTSLEIDRREAADFIVLEARDMRIAARIRRNDGKFRYDKDYPFDITIRSFRPSGAVTELLKIEQGWGDWFFYGHAHPEADAVWPEITRWWLVDLHNFRFGLIKDRHEKTGTKIRYTEKCNSDGTRFRAYDLRSFLPTPSILVASSHPLYSGHPVMVK